MQSEWYRLFSHFWWLIFPLFSLVWGLTDQWSRHNRAKQGLEIIKAYVAQGKDPPPELVQALQAPASLRRKDPDAAQIGKWVPLGLFTGLCVGFVLLAFSHIGREDSDAMAGLLFVALIMGGLAAGFLASILVTRKRSPAGDRAP